MCGYEDDYTREEHFRNTAPSLESESQMCQNDTFKF